MPSAKCEVQIGALPLLRRCICDTRLVDYAPKRIVSLQPSITVILRDLGRLDALVACTKYCAALCPEVGQRGVTIVADSWSAQAGQISALQPDLVIASVPYQEKSIGEIMKTGARFLGFAPKSLADIYGDIAVIASLMNAPERGWAVIQRVHDSIEGVRSRTSALQKMRVFCEEWGKPLIASQRWVAELVEAAGGEFLGTPGAQILPEEVRALAPEVCIAAWCGAGDRVPLSKIVQQRRWEDLPAAKNWRVYCIRDEYLNTPAPTLMLGLRALAAAIHPEHFPQADGLRSIKASR
jgi:iron complex transport system substrate-binding protein